MYDTQPHSPIAGPKSETIAVHAGMRYLGLGNGQGSNMSIGLHLPATCTRLGPMGLPYTTAVHESLVSTVTRK